MTPFKVSSSRASLRWIILAWFLFRSSALLWMVPAAALTTTSLFCGLLLTGHLHPAAYLALSLVHVPQQPVFLQHLVFLQLPMFPQLSASLQPDKIVIPFASFLLLLLALAVNTAMTGMANRVVRGSTISVRDLFRFGGFGAASLALGTTLLAAVAGSLVLFVGSIVALGLLLASQSAAVRTRRFLSALRASAIVIRCDPARTLVLAAFVLLTLVLGIATGGLGLLVAIPVVKIIGAFADVFAEAREEQQNLGQQNLERSGNHSALPGTPASPACTFTWTQGEELMLRRTAPPVPLSHWVTSGLVLLLSAYLFLPDTPAAATRPENTALSDNTALSENTALSDNTALSENTARPEGSGLTAQPAAASAPDAAASPQPDAGASAAPKSADGVPAALASAVAISSYDPDNPPNLPCRMQWGNYTVLIEQENSDEVIPPKKLSILDAAGIPVYTITDDQIGEVKTEPLLNGPQPELLIRTEEGGDGVNGIHLALTQQGSVHALFFLAGQYQVRTQHLSGGAGENANPAGENANPAGENANPAGENANPAGGVVIVDTPLDVPLSDIHHYPLLTSTYRWNGREFENATQFVRGPTEERVAQYEQELVSPADLEDAERTTVGLLANMNILGIKRLPASVMRSGGFQSGVAWLRANPQSQQDVIKAILDAKKSLPNVSGSAISSDSSQSDSSQSDSSQSDSSQSSVP